MFLSYLDGIHREYFFSLAQILAEEEKLPFGQREEGLSLFRQEMGLEADPPSSYPAGLALGVLGQLSSQQRGIVFFELLAFCQCDDLYHLRWKPFLKKIQGSLKISDARAKELIECVKEFERLYRRSLEAIDGESTDKIIRY